MPLKIIRADLLTVKAEAVVNAANRKLVKGGGVCGQIFKAAGVKELRAACKKFLPIETDEAVIPFNLEVKSEIYP